MFRELKTIIDTQNIINFPIVAPKNTPVPFCTINVTESTSYQCLSGFINSKNIKDKCQINVFSNTLEEAINMKDNILGALIYNRPTNIFFHLDSIHNNYDGHYQITILFTMNSTFKIARSVCRLTPSINLILSNSLVPCNF